MTISALIGALGNLDPNWFIVALTVVLAWLTREQVRANRIVERGYVDISHKPPGLKRLADSFSANFEVKNYGRTPADVTAVSLTLHIGNELPATPVYQTATTPTRAFLMPNESFHFYRDFRRRRITPEEFSDIAAERLTVWVIGYVEYRDRFGKSHRGGYARRYFPQAADASLSNLIFESAGNYNYDVDV